MYEINQNVAISAYTTPVTYPLVSMLPVKHFAYPTTPSHLHYRQNSDQQHTYLRTGDLGM